MNGSREPSVLTLSSRHAKQAKRIALLVLSLGSTICIPLQQAHAETKHFVMNWFTLATNSQDGDCRNGENPGIEDMYRGILREMGYSPAKIEELMKGYRGGGGREFGDLVVNRGRIDGKPVNVYDNPTSFPDKPQISTVTGKYGYGFNLDGKTGEEDFEDPVTGEKGIDNQFVRAMGCFHSHRAAPPERSGYWSYAWDASRAVVQAWLISVSGDDLSRDGEVTVAFSRGMERVIRNANAEAQRDQSFNINPDPRTQTVFRGRIKDGIISTEPSEMHMITGGAYFPLQWDMHSVNMRLQIKEDGSLEGLIGGYQPWLQLYFMYGTGGYGMEGMIGVNIPGTYYALRRLADADKDPVTGQNASISTAYRVEAVPAFVVSGELRNPKMD